MSYNKSYRVGVGVPQKNKDSTSMIGERFSRSGVKRQG